MDSRKQKILWFGVSTAIIAGLIYFADFNKFLNSLQAAKHIYLLPAFFFGMAVFTVYGYVWYHFFKSMKLGLSYFKSLRLFVASEFMNSITPLGQFGGEPLMAYIVSRNSDASYERSFSAVLSSDMVNAVPTITFVTGGVIYLLLFGSSVTNIIVQLFYIVLVGFFLGATLLYLLWFRTGTIESAILRIIQGIVSVTGRGEKYIGIAEERLARVEESFKTVGDSPRQLLKTGLIAHLAFLSQILCLYFVLLSLGYNVDFTPLYFVFTLSGLANYSPTPGGAGAYEGAMAGLLTLFIPGIPFADALIAGILFRMTTYWPGLIIGYLALNSIEYSEQ